MRASLQTTVLAFGALAAYAAPTQPQAGVFPPGFPNPSPAQIQQIQQQAFGTLPNGPPPAKLSAAGATNLQLIAFNEIFEVAFFNSLLNNVTSKASGYQIADPKNYTTTVNTLKAILAQEELHALNANNALQHFGHAQIQPCTKYIFGTTNFHDAIKLAGTFTSVVLGTLQDATQSFAENGDAPLTRLVASVIGQEGEQEGWFRLLQDQIPNELPFLTTSAAPFAFTALQGFAAPGSCPSVASIGIKTLKPLTVVDTPHAATQTIHFSVAAAGFPSNEKLYITYINQQNVPVTEPATYTSTSNGMATVSATFPYSQFELNGLTIASLSTCAGPYATADDVANEAIYGPGLIIVQPN
jgi:hypothetical protein